ncbi:MAG: HD domain-containing protein [Chloroflexi bacterium]|nr:HD domain-containing protein [Chloroflexota bacterium]
MVTVADIRKEPQIEAFLRGANQQLKVLGYTEHGQRHASLVSNIGHNILERLGYSKRTADLAAIAGYMHDVGNVIHRDGHALGSAIIAMQVLPRLGMNYDEVATVMGAIGNHEEERGVPSSEVTAAVIIADKADVHRSRVQNPDPDQFDIHDRVNFASRRSFVRVDGDKRVIALELDIDTDISRVMEYFEIFMSRMVISRRAARYLGCKFELCINGDRLF